MMLPVSVMKVMPTATQPMNEIALSSALMLSGVGKPGVVSAKIAIAAAGDDADRQRRRAVRAAARSGAVLARERDVAHAAATGWVMSASTRCMSASPRR